MACRRSLILCQLRYSIAPLCLPSSANPCLCIAGIFAFHPWCIRQYRVRLLKQLGFDVGKYAIGTIRTRTMLTVALLDPEHPRAWLHREVAFAGLPPLGPERTVLVLAFDRP